MDYKIEMDNFLKGKEGSTVTMAEKAFKWLTEPVSYEEKDMPDRVVTPWTKEEDVKWTKKKIPVRRYEQLINDGANVATSVYMGSMGLSTLAQGINQWRFNRAVDAMTQRFQAEMAKRSGQLAPENITRLLNWFQKEAIPQAAYAKTFPERGSGRVGMYAGVPMVPQEPSKKLPLITSAQAQVTPALQPQGEGKIYYHGTSAKTETILNEGIKSDKTRTGAISATDNPEIAKRFGDVVEIRIPQNAQDRILDLTQGRIEADLVRKGFPVGKWYNPDILETDARIQTLIGFEDLSQAQKKWLADKGYIGVKIPTLEAGPKGNEIRFVAGIPKEYISKLSQPQGEGKVWYHGGKKLSDIKMGKGKFQKTFYITDDPTYAKSHGGANSVVNEVILSNDANLADMSKPSDSLIAEIQTAIAKREAKNIPYSKDSFSFYPYSTKEVIQGIKDGKAHFAELPQIKEILKELGYDGQITSEVPFAKNIGVWNKDVVKLSQPQREGKVETPLDAHHIERAIKLLNESGVPVKSGEDILTLYHGTNAKGMKGITESGTINPFSYLATDKTAAGGFAFGRKGGVIEIKVPVSDAGYVQTPMAGTKGATIQNPLKLIKGKDGIYRVEEKYKLSQPQGEGVEVRFQGMTKEEWIADRLTKIDYNRAKKAESEIPKLVDKKKELSKELNIKQDVLSFANKSKLQFELKTVSDKLRQAENYVAKVKNMGNLFDFGVEQSKLSQPQNKKGK